MKNVLFVSSYPNSRCGVSDYSEKLIEQFSKDKIAYTLVTIKFADNPIKYVTDSIFLIIKLLNHKLDIVHFQYTPTVLGPLLPIFISLALRKKLKIITTVHEMGETYSNKLSFYLKQIFIAYENYIFNKSSIIVVMSDMQKNYFLKKKITKNKILLIPHGIDSKINISEYKNSNINFKKYPYVCFFGHIRKEKGLELLFDAFSKIFTTNKKLQLLIVGETKNKKYLEKIKNSISEEIRGNIIWTGQLKINEALYLISKSLYIVLPYKKNTNSGVLMNAISVQTPIIGSNIGVIGEYLNKFSIGKVFLNGNSKDLMEKMLNLMIKKNEIIRYKKNEKKLIHCYSWNKICCKHMKLYST